eukprot:TRINITY_DN20851_c0_g1_i1.p1 TRINITY_DN20851_c0_g1~~TRINITY_DN20851_c0_g1_i1.p1  ORF type:complete len:352 (-),score=109.05 TRINITY_DN20851_c0_g1_i1:105-1160(-)
MKLSRLRWGARTCHDNVSHQEEIRKLRERIQVLEGQLASTDPGCHDVVSQGLDVEIGKKRDWEEMKLKASRCNEPLYLHMRTVEDFEAAVERERSAKRAVEHELTHTKSRLDEAEATLQLCGVELHALQRAQVAAEQTIYRNQQEMQDLKEDKQAMEDRHAAAMAESVLEVERSQEQLGVSQEQLSSVSHRLLSEHNGVLPALEKSLLQISHLEEELQSSQAVQQTLKTQVTKYAAAVSSLQKLEGSLRQQLVLAREGTHDWHDQDAAAQLAVAVGERDRAEEEASSLADQLRASQEDVSALQRELFAALGERDQAREAASRLGSGGNQAGGPPTGKKFVLATRNLSLIHI